MNRYIVVADYRPDGTIEPLAVLDWQAGVTSYVNPARPETFERCVDAPDHLEALRIVGAGEWPEPSEEEKRAVREMHAAGVAAVEAWRPAAAGMDSTKRYVGGGAQEGRNQPY